MYCSSSHSTSPKNPFQSCPSLEPSGSGTDRLTACRACESEKPKSTSRRKCLTSSTEEKRYSLVLRVSAIAGTAARATTHVMNRAIVFFMTGLFGLCAQRARGMNSSKHQRACFDYISEESTKA